MTTITPGGGAVSRPQGARILVVDRAIARRAADLRARRRLRPADSLQIATALEAGATHVVTNDHDVRRVAEIRVMLLDSFRAAG